MSPSFGVLHSSEMNLERDLNKIKYLLLLHVLLAGWCHGTRSEEEKCSKHDNGDQLYPCLSSDQRGNGHGLVDKHAQLRERAEAAFSSSFLS